MQLSRLIYVSCHQSTGIEVFDSILQKSRMNNVRDGITGALVISRKHFLQLLEGDQDLIAKAFMRIMQDSRHHDIRVISAGREQSRLFYEWSMHRIEASRIKPQILTRYTSDGNFDPQKMSPLEIWDLCRTLSLGDWDIQAA